MVIALLNSGILFICSALNYLHTYLYPTKKMNVSHNSSPPSVVQSDATNCSRKSLRNSPRTSSLSMTTSQSKRRDTFKTYPTPHYVNPSDLAKHGFMFQNNTVICAHCRKKVDKWGIGDQPDDPKFHEEKCMFAKKVSMPMELMEDAEEPDEPERMDDTPTASAMVTRSQAKKDASNLLSLQVENYTVRKHDTQPSSLPPIRLKEWPRTQPPPSVTSDTSEEIPIARLTPVHMLKGLHSDSESVASGPVQNFTSTPARNRGLIQSEPVHGRPIEDPNQPSSSRNVRPPRRNQSSGELSDEEVRNQDMKVAKNRLRTFERFWSLNNIFKNIRLLAICGFFCLGYGDAVQCFYCETVLANWSRNDDPRRRHRECSPSCRFAQGENCGDVPLPPVARRRAPESISSRERTRRSLRNSAQEPQPPSLRSPSSQLEEHLPIPSTEPSHPESALPEAYSNLSRAQLERNNLMLQFPCENPANESMRDERVRLQTFTNSQFRGNTQLRASNRTLAQAGLYYDGSHDCTKCWFCGGGLKEYLPNDDPWVEHAKYYPECEYLLQQRGPAWVTSISVQHPNVQRPILPQRQGNVLPSIGASANVLANPALDAAMLTHPVQHARTMGFSEELIRGAQMRRITQLGSCYQTSEALIEALLHPNTDPATLEAAAIAPQQNISYGPPEFGGGGRTITINGGNYVGQSIIGGRLQPRSSRRNVMTINGMPLEEYIANQGNDVDMEDYGSGSVHVFNNIGTTISPSGSSGGISEVVSPIPPPRSTSSSASGSSPAAPTGSAEERLENLERERRCKICLSAPSDILFQPCGHICACLDCARRLNACPVCRRGIARYVRTYHA